MRPLLLQMHNKPPSPQRKNENNSEIAQKPAILHISWSPPIPNYTLIFSRNIDNLESGRGVVAIFPYRQAGPEIYFSQEDLFSSPVQTL